MKWLIDTNVILDVWLAREPFVRDSARVLGELERGAATGIVCPTTITTLRYLARKVLGDKRARQQIESLLKICQVGVLSADTFTDALKSGIRDFEDAVIEAVAVAEKADCIVTRNTTDFRKSRLPAREPAALRAE